MPKLTDEFKADAIALNYTNAVSNSVAPFGQGLFPADKMEGLDLSWFKGHNGLAISLAPSTFDAKARFRDRVGVEKMETEMPFFREAMIVKEKDEQEYMKVASSNSKYAEQILKNIFRDTQNLIDGANVVPERMRMQLLAPLGGSLGINITANGVDYTYNYDPTGSWKAAHYSAIETEADKWTSPATCDPIGDILARRKAQYQETGEYPAVMLMTDETFSLIYNSEKVRSGFLAKNTSAIVEYLEDEVKAYVETRTKMKIVLYDKMFKDEKGVAKKYYADNIVMMIPNRALGTTWYGTTPEERSGSESGADVAIVSTGVAIETYTTQHPINTVCVASEIVLPSFEEMDFCCAIEVA
jgi:hypothetical protein